MECNFSPATNIKQDSAHPGDTGKSRMSAQPSKTLLWKGAN